MSSTINHPPGTHHDVNGHRLWIEQDDITFAGDVQDVAGLIGTLRLGSRLVRFYNPDNAALLLTEPGARNLELYPLFCGADVDFIIGGEVPKIPDFRPRLKKGTHSFTSPTGSRSARQSTPEC